MTPEFFQQTAHQHSIHRRRNRGEGGHPGTGPQLSTYRGHAALGPNSKLCDCTVKLTRILLQIISFSIGV